MKVFKDLAIRLEPLNGVLVDSNILIDIGTAGREWGGWSSNALAEAAEHTRLLINPIIFAEVSIGYDNVQDLERALPEELYEREPLPWEAAFLAGKCFVNYRRRGGQRTAPLPDFYIGAHATVRSLAILTRDASRYRTYFPKLPILGPDSPRLT
jgi:predicted nucleic acid-binding protein